MKNRDIELNGKTAVGVEIKLPKSNLVLAHGKKGFVMCGFLNLEVAEKMGEAAAIVRGVKTVDDLLKANVVAATSAARKLGIKDGLSGEEALKLLS